MPSQGRRSRPKKPQVQGETGAEGSSPVQIRIVPLSEVNVTAPTQIVIYREEGFYLIGIDPTRIVEVQSRFGTRYFAVGVFFNHFSDAAAALKAHEDLVVNGQKPKRVDIVYIPKRLLRELKEALKKIEVGRLYLGVIHASGTGRNRTYTRLVKPHVGPRNFEVDDEDLQDALQRLERFVIAGSGKNEEGESE